MKITIEFKTDNAAFEEDYEGEVEMCLGRALRAVRRRLSHAKIFDTNGNSVGEVRTEDADDPTSSGSES